MRPQLSAMTSWPMRLMRAVMMIWIAAFAALTLWAAPAQAALPSDVVTRQSDSSPLVWHYPKRFEPAIERLMPRAQRSMDSLSERLALPKVERIDIWLISDLDHYYDWNELPSRAPEWAVGLSLVNKRTILVKHGVGKDGALVDLNKTLDHELAHVAVDLARQGHHLPLWFNEGFAQWHAQEWTLESGELVARSAGSRVLLPMESLDRSFPDHQNTTSLAYAQSHHFVRHLVHLYGEQIWPKIMTSVRDGETFSVAFSLATGDDFENVQRRWFMALTQNSSPLSVFADGTLLFFGASVLFVVAWGVRRRRARRKFETLDDGIEAWSEPWSYDPSRYPLPEYGSKPAPAKEVWRAAAQS